MFERLAVIVPAYNAERHIGPVLADIIRYIPPRAVIVVDDGSWDATAVIAEAAGVTVIRHGTNKGKGTAVRTGIERLHSFGGIDAVIMLDADGQHDPHEIPLFAEEFAGGNADLIIGNRMADRTTMPFLRRCTNWTTSAIISARAGCRVPDSQNGYRLVSAPLLARLHLVSARYEIDSEIIIKACRRGNARVSSVPVRTIYGTERSAIHPVRDTARFLALVVRSLFW